MKTDNLDGLRVLIVPHQNQLQPAGNKFHLGNGSDGKHYWLTPPDLYAQLDAAKSGVQAPAAVEESKVAKT